MTSNWNLIIRLLSAMLIMAMSIATAWGVSPGAVSEAEYLPLLEGKRVALLSNHTGVAEGEHTLDRLLRHGVDVQWIFSPEHGFRGSADAGEHVKSGVDAATGIPLTSLYGGKQAEIDRAMSDFDVLVVDLQDVGARFYTYHITMAQMMERCGKMGKEVIVLDRPNPLIMTVDGPVLEPEVKSGVGKFPIPLIHGMTMGELALMIAGEGWIGTPPKVSVIRCADYDRGMMYELPVAPSPNLKSMQAVLLYPSLCLFEGTNISVGRGTDCPFTLYGNPWMKSGTMTFVPRSMPGARDPMYKGRVCRGRDLNDVPQDSIIARGFDLSYVVDAYENSGRHAEEFFTRFFDLLAGNKKLRKQIISGTPIAEIRKSWEKDLEDFKRRREPYLLYPEPGRAVR